MYKKLKLLEKFNNGWHGKGDNCSVSFRTTKLERCLKDAAEGCLVVDKYGLGVEAISHAINGPIVDTTLPPNTINKFQIGNQAVLMLGVGGLEGAFKHFLQKKVDFPKWSGLDNVSLDIHVLTWRKLGARVGKVVDGKVVWEDDLGHEEPYYGLC